MTDLSNFQMGELMLGKKKTAVKAKSETKAVKTAPAEEPKTWVKPKIFDAVTTKDLAPRNVFGLQCDADHLLNGRKEGAVGVITNEYKGNRELLVVEHKDGSKGCYHPSELWVLESAPNVVV